MSLKAQAIYPVPQETARVARAAFPKGNLYMQMRDVLGSIYTDEDFADLFPKEGQPAQAPWRLALVTVMQFLENLSDRQAADAVRARIDWKYLLGLDLTDPGFDASVLSEFRARLIEENAQERLLEKMLTLFGQKGWLKARGRQRTDSTHVLGKIRALNRVLCVWETMRAALNSLAIVAPDWRSTNKVEQYNAFEDWITFASAGIIYERAYAEQEKRIKYTGIIANCVMLDNTVEISAALNRLAKEGLVPTIDELAALSPYQTRHIKRFGNYELDVTAVPVPITDDLTFAIEPPD